MAGIGDQDWIDRARLERVRLRHSHFALEIVGLAAEVAQLADRLERESAELRRKAEELLNQTGTQAAIERLYRDLIGEDD